MLRRDEEFKYTVLGLLGIDKIFEELKKLREDFNAYVKQSEERWNKFLEEWNSWRKENELKWEANEKRWIENMKRWEANEKRWEENMKRWEANEKRWIENQKRWEANEKRWKANEKRWIENMKRWEANEKRWIENQKRWEENMKRWIEAQNNFKWMMNALQDIRDALGGGFEYYTARVVKLILKEKGIDADVGANVTVVIDGQKEVDIFCKDPLIIGEVTITLRTIEEAEGQLEKLKQAVEAAEKFMKKKAFMKVIAVEFVTPEVAKFLEEKSKELGLYLILGRQVI